MTNNFPPFEQQILSNLFEGTYQQIEYDRYPYIPSWYSVYQGQLPFLVLFHYSGVLCTRDMNVSVSVYDTRKNQMGFLFVLDCWINTLTSGDIQETIIKDVWFEAIEAFYRWNYPDNVDMCPFKIIDAGVIDSYRMMLFIKKDIIEEKEKHYPVEINNELIDIRFKILYYWKLNNRVRLFLKMEKQYDPLQFMDVSDTKGLYLEIETKDMENATIIIAEWLDSISRRDFFPYSDLLVNQLDSTLTGLDRLSWECNSRVNGGLIPL